MKFEVFKDQFHESWHKDMKPLLESEWFHSDFQKLKEDGKKYNIYPSSKSGNLFRIFREVPKDKLVAAVVGLSPYFMSVDGVEVADGIALSCSNTKKEQPSLTQWYNAMEKEYGEIIRNPDLSYLTKQGIFMYNYALTCLERGASAHLEIWERFTLELFKMLPDIPVITLGKEAAKVSAVLAPWQTCIQLTHPASASYRDTDWDSQGAFTTVEQELLNQGIHITWVQRKDKF